MGGWVKPVTGRPAGNGAEPLRASVASGQRAAAGFVSVPWVREQLRQLLGRDPFPGTLNVQLREPHSLDAWRRHTCTSDGLALPAGEPGFCDSSYFPVLLNGSVPCGIVLPHVPGLSPRTWWSWSPGRVCEIAWA